LAKGSAVPLLYMLASISIIIGVGALVLPMAGINLIPGSQVSAGQETYAGPITPRMAHQDVLSASTTFNEGSNVQTKWLRCTGCVGVPSSGYSLMTTGNSTFSSLAQDNNVVFITTEGRTGDTLYLGVKETLDSNPGILQQYSYTDYDNDGVEDHLFRVTFAGIALAGGQTTLDLPVNGRWYQYEQPTGSVQEPGSTGNVQEVGEAQNNTQVFRFRYTSASFDTSALVREFHLIFNGSDTSQWTIDKVVIPFWNSASQSFVDVELTESDIDETVLSSNSTYKFFFADDLSSIQNSNTVMATKTGGTKYNDVLVYVTWTIQENESIILDSRIKYWTDDQIERQGIANIVVHDEGPLA
jgi:hypothetical protein